jgi:hypothetical protein
MTPNLAAVAGAKAPAPVFVNDLLICISVNFRVLLAAFLELNLKSYF